MENYTDSHSTGRDPQLWEIARRRASFKYHLGTYIVVIAFLWAVWLFTGDDSATREGKFPWPVWPTGGWGIGLLFHYFGAYISPKENTAEKEYQKLIRNKK
jgi:hypothetical protein